MIGRYLLSTISSPTLSFPCFPDSLHPSFQLPTLSREPLNREPGTINALSFGLLFTFSLLHPRLVRRLYGGLVRRTCGEMANSPYPRPLLPAISFSAHQLSLPRFPLSPLPSSLITDPRSLALLSALTFELNIALSYQL
jgi:hypothetical protein